MIELRTPGRGHLQAELKWPTPPTDNAMPPAAVADEALHEPPHVEIHSDPQQVLPTHSLDGSVHGMFLCARMLFSYLAPAPAFAHS